MFSVYLPLKMTTCAAKGCYNSSKKKVKMNCFLTDPDRRKAWISQCVEFGNMTNWTPKDYSALCSVSFHFSFRTLIKIRGNILHKNIY